MKVLITALAIVAAVFAQGQLGGALVLGTTPLDLGLIAVVCIALTSGPTVGLLAGMCAGLAQDALGGGIIASKGAIIGIGGLANTVVGFLVGQASTQFIVTGALPRLLAFFGSTALHAVIFMGLYELLGLAHFGLPWGGVVGQGLANALVGVLILQAIELLPGAVERRQAQKGTGFRVNRRLD